MERRGMAFRPTGDAAAVAGYLVPWLVQMGNR